MFFIDFRHTKNMSGPEKENLIHSMGFTNLKVELMRFKCSGCTYTSGKELTKKQKEDFQDTLKELEKIGFKFSKDSEEEK